MKVVAFLCVVDQFLFLFGHAGSACSRKDSCLFAQQDVDTQIWFGNLSTCISRLTAITIEYRSKFTANITGYSLLWLNNIKVWTFSNIPKSLATSSISLANYLLMCQEVFLQSLHNSDKANTKGEGGGFSSFSICRFENKSYVYTFITPSPPPRP